MGYPGNTPLLAGINLHVQSGERIALTGPNGCGKTTLLRIIVGQLPPLGGQVRLGASVKLGFMSQGQEILEPTKNTVETIQQVAPFNVTVPFAPTSQYLFRLCLSIVEVWA